MTVSPVTSGHLASSSDRSPELFAIGDGVCVCCCVYSMDTDVACSLGVLIFGFTSIVSFDVGLMFSILE